MCIFCHTWIFRNDWGQPYLSVSDLLALYLGCTINIILIMMRLVTFACVVKRKKQFYFRNYDRRSEQVSRIVLSLFQISVRELAEFLGGASPIWAVYRTHDSKILQMANSLRQRLGIPDAWTCPETLLKISFEFTLWQDGLVCLKKKIIGCSTVDFAVSKRLHNVIALGSHLQESLKGF